MRLHFVLNVRVPHRILDIVQSGFFVRYSGITFFQLFFKNLLVLFHLNIEFYVCKHRAFNVPGAHKHQSIIPAYRLKTCRHQFWGGREKN